ncbi:MAG: hypothetical protein VYC39_10095 [Myxococcota bacterium]|nr:hypothetical protein [Myxococcota bacterium]
MLVQLVTVIVWGALKIQSAIMKILPIYSILFIPAFVTLNTTSATADGSQGRFYSTATETGYIAWVNNMPDLDQKREGLLLDGTNYCGPAAASNILTFIANSGYPEIEPGLVDNAWEPTPEAAPGVLRKRLKNRMTYSEQTDFIDEVRREVTNFDPSRGSKVYALRNALESFLPDSFEVSYLGDGKCGDVSTDRLEPDHIFWNLALGRPSIIHFSRYNIDDNGLYQRVGGHYVTPVFISGNYASGRILLGYRDSSAGDSDINSQSEYTTEYRYLKRELVPQIWVDSDTGEEHFCRKYYWTMHRTAELNDPSPQAMEWMLYVTPGEPFPGARELDIPTP